MNHRNSNIALIHTIRDEKGTAVITMLSYGSIKLSKLYMKNFIPPSVRISDLRMTDAYFTLLD